MQLRQVQVLALVMEAPQSVGGEGLHQQLGPKEAIANWRPQNNGLILKIKGLEIKSNQNYTLIDSLQAHWWYSKCSKVTGGLKTAGGGATTWISSEDTLSLGLLWPFMAQAPNLS